MKNSIFYLSFNLSFDQEPAQFCIVFFGTERIKSIEVIILVNQQSHEVSQITAETLTVLYGVSHNLLLGVTGTMRGSNTMFHTSN